MDVGESRVFINWDEVVVSSEKGNRIVHYFLIRSVGGSDLAVIGKEKSPRHMSYAVSDHFLSFLRPSSAPKLRSRREVVGWLSSLVTAVDRALDDEEPCSAEAQTSKGSSRKVNHLSKEFSWLGSPWTCRKRRRHYQSFCRNGITISVHDFVFVMGEEHKRLVAHLQDMYEDTRGSNMVVVRWFHKTDEVGIVLPPSFNDREILFSLCLQDLSVECIDGLATVLSAQHFVKFLNEVKNPVWDPYMCQQLVDNEDIKSFDITQVNGYWNQELLKHMYSSTYASPRNSSKKPPLSADSKSRLKRKDKPFTDPLCIRIKKAVRNGGVSAASLRQKEMSMPKPLLQLPIGCQVEVLSQDSGLRGCWFRAVIIKKHKEKVKVQYQDLSDAAEDETSKLEEWVLASRIAAADKLGVRLCGRSMVRPFPPAEGKIPLGCFGIGGMVDVWWHDGWWEGIVVQKEPDDKLRVYFPGEGQTSTFDRGNLRVSQDWVCNRWSSIKARPDLVRLILCKEEEKEISDCKAQVCVTTCGRQIGSQIGSNGHLEGSESKDDATPCNSSVSTEHRIEKGREGEVSNLVKDDTFLHLKWKVSKKRRYIKDSLPKGNLEGNLDSKRQCDGSGSSGSCISREGDVESPGSERFVIPESLEVDREICKYSSDPRFAPSMPPSSSLVMSRLPAKKKKMNQTKKKTNPNKKKKIENKRRGPTTSKNWFLTPTGKPKIGSVNHRRPAPRFTDA